MTRWLTTLALCVLACAMTPERMAEDRAAALWQTPFEDCSSARTQVDEAFVQPVAANLRSEAIGLLNAHQFATLSDAEAARLIGAALPRSGSLALHLAREADNEIAHDPVGDLERWRALKAELSSGAAAARRPSLVRAVAKNEVLSFSVSVCGNVLSVVHSSLGRGPAPPSHRAPLVVFLNRPPARVETTWSMAE